jgi:hypothetical protein
MTVTFSKLGTYGQRGNMLFQIAATIGYAKKYKVPYIFPKWEHQNEFAISDEYFVNINKIKFDNTYKESNFRYNKIPFKKNCDLFGYFQSCKYFDNCTNYIKECFEFKNPENHNKYKDICAIHIRHGDYIKFFDYHSIQTMKYYNEAMKKIPCEKYIIFSDDIKWCRKNFIGNQFIINETGSSVIDFKLMSACNHFIIANSSFSWWAAWLSKHSNKVIIAPNNWFGPKLKKLNPIDDLIPTDWILI